MQSPPLLRRVLIVASTLATSVVALACGPTALRTEGGGGRLNLGGAASRSLETLTDLEEVRAVVRQDGLLYVATDAGLLRYPSVDAAGERVEGLPTDDVRGLVPTPEGLLVATAAGMVILGAGDAVTPVHGAPALGHLMDMVTTADGAVWLCGLGGVARKTSGGAWEVLSEGRHCTDLAPTPEGQLWVGLTDGLWYVDGEVVREHPTGSGLPEAYVREIVPVLPGQIMTILQGPSRTELGYWDGQSWHAYTLPGLEEPIVGLVRRGNDVLLITERHALVIAPRGGGVPLAPLGSREGTVRSFRPTLVPAAEHTATEAAPASLVKEPSRLAEVPENQPTIQAPAFRAAPLEMDLPGRLDRAFVYEAEAFLAIANGGVVQLAADGHVRAFRSLSLVPEEDLQIATDSGGTTWTLSREGHLARLVNGRLRRAEAPDGLRVHALATGGQGAYLVALDPATQNTLRIYTNGGRGWTPLVSRTLTLATALTAAPFAGVAPDGLVWVAIEVEREEGSGRRMRGVAVIDPGSETVVYHHRGADQAQGGLPLPDEITAMDFDTENAWFASLSGLVRLGNHQAVVFGESRGVRGEVVMDTAVGTGEIWIASAEGVGRYDRTRFDYALPAFVQSARPTRVAVDTAGHVWAASSQGLLRSEGGEWTQIGAADGLSNPNLIDVEADEAGRLWMLAEDRVMLLAR